VGARDLKTGFSSLKKDILHPKTVIEFGVLENESKKLLQSFFEQKRK
jgi:tRNA(adenine34) deaminase